MDVEKLERLVSLLRNAWEADTSATPQIWRPENPARGQGDVTSLVVQDYLGGNIVNAQARFDDGSVEPHFYNDINDNLVDLSSQQFPADAVVSDVAPGTPGVVNLRDTLAANPDLANRYNILKQRVAQALTGGAPRQAAPAAAPPPTDESVNAVPSPGQTPATPPSAPPQAPAPSPAPEPPPAAQSPVNPNPQPPDATPQYNTTNFGGLDDPSKPQPL